MQRVFCRLVVNVEDPVFERQPVVSDAFLPFRAQSVAAGRRQKVKSFQSHPEVQRVAGTKPVLVVVPRQVPAERARRVALHEHDPVENGNHRNGCLSGNREGYRLVLCFVICQKIEFTKSTQTPVMKLTCAKSDRNSCIAEEIIGRPLQVTVRAMLRDRCLVCPRLSVTSETLVSCGRTAEWTKMPLGTEVGLGPCRLWPNG